MFPDFPDSAQPLGASVAWCIMLALLLAIALVWNIRNSPLYPVLLSIRDAEPFAEAAGIRTASIKVGIFALSAAMAGGAGWLFSFLGVVSPSQFSWAVSLNILVMVLVGGINTTFGPVIGAVFVSMFPAVVNINPWLQEILYGALVHPRHHDLPRRRGRPGQASRLRSGDVGRRCRRGRAGSALDEEGARQSRAVGRAARTRRRPATRR